MTFPVRTNYTGVATPTATNWTASDALAVSQAVNTSVQFLPAPTGVAATDTAAIQAAHDALPANGGRLNLARGDYYLTATGPVFTKQVVLLGQGSAKPSNQGGTTLVSNSATATGITCNVEGCYLDGFSIVNNFSGTVTAGSGIRMQKAHHAMIGPNILVWGFFDNITFEAGHYWKCYARNHSPWRYGMVINNADDPDSGDNEIGGWFDMPGVTRNATAAIRWETGGGFRFTGKINAVGTNKFGIGIDFAYNGTPGSGTADLFITPGSSIENCASIGVKMARTSGTNVVALCQILGLEMMNIPTGIQVGAGFEDVLIDHIIGFGMTTGVDILATATKVTVGGTNRWRAVTTPVSIASGATDIDVRRQIRGVPHDGIVINDASTAVVGSTIIDYNYDRSIGFTVSSTAQALFALNLDNYDGGVIEVGASGLHNGTGGFSVYRRVGYQTNGSGVVTITPITLEVVGSTTSSSGPQLTFVTATGGVTVKIATPDSQSIGSGRAFIRVTGRPLQFRIGA